jgi:hypothetical protein
MFIFQSEIGSKYRDINEKTGKCFLARETTLNRKKHLMFISFQNIKKFTALWKNRFIQS